MFYSIELLSRRRKGKLARCWLAAVFSEAMFKRICKPASIKQIDVVVTCEEILSTIEVRTGANYGRFSLYLSAQLMYGITKIHLYQIKLFQEFLFELNWKLFQMKRSKKTKKILNDIEISTIPSVGHVLRYKEAGNMHLLTEDPYISGIEIMMQDEMNFGILPNHEMEMFMQPDAEELPLSEVRRFRCDQSLEVPEMSVQVPLVDVTNFGIDSSETEIEIRSQYARHEQHNTIDVVADSCVTTHGLATPRKRSIRISTEGTPRKRSRIISPKELVPASQIKPKSVVEHTPEVTFEPDIQLEMTDALPMQNVGLIEEIKPNKSRRRKLFDQRTKLSDNIMQKLIENVTVHTTISLQYLPTVLSAREYLRQPSTKIATGLWGDALIKLFQRSLVKPLDEKYEYSDILDLNVIDTADVETVRADISANKLRDQTGNLSSKLGITTISTTDTSKTLDKILPTVVCKPHVPNEQSKEIPESEQLLVELPEINGFDAQIKQNSMENKILDRESNGRKFKGTSKSSCSALVSKARLSKRELLALMDVHWSGENLIKYHELIPPENYTKLDAACTFYYCLEFQMEKIAILKQADPFDTIWIEKYPYYSSESGEGIDRV